MKIKEMWTKYSQKLKWKMRWKAMSFKRRHFSRMLGNYLIISPPVVMNKGTVVVTALDNNLSSRVRKKGEVRSPKAVVLMFLVKPKFVEKVVRAMRMGNTVCVSGTRMRLTPGKKGAYYVDKYMVLGVPEKCRKAPVQYYVFDRDTETRVEHILDP